MKSNSKTIDIFPCTVVVDLFPCCADIHGIVSTHVECVVCLSRKTTHEMKLHASPFEMIKSGAKNIELRLFDEKRQKIKTGDDIIFTNTFNGEKICATVKTLKNCIKPCRFCNAVILRKMLIQHIRLIWSDIILLKNRKITVLSALSFFHPNRLQTKFSA